MKIVNIDAPEHLARKVTGFLEFTIEVVRPLEHDFYNHHVYHQVVCGEHLYHPHRPLSLSPIWKFDECGYENIAALIHTIPIYLRDSRPLEICNENSIIDLLGAYFNRNGNSPYIELYLTDIYGSAENDDKNFKWLFTKVLIHELAHAALDIFNWEHTPQSEKVYYHEDFGKWREESMANAVALRIIKEYGDEEFYSYAKQYMQSQPPEYALGVLMEDFGRWDFRSVFNAKEQGVDSRLKQEWLNYVKGTPDWEGLKKWNVLLNTHYVYLFEGKYYNSEEIVVYDIVNKVLSDYEHNNGGKMSFNTFRSLFPYIKIGAKMSYEPAEKVVGDSRFRNKIELVDGNYSLYCNGWNNDTLHKFIDTNKLNINIIEYKNWI